VQRHFGSDPRERLHQEVGGTHSGFDGAEGVFDRFAARAHFFRMPIKPTLDLFENVLVLIRRSLAVVHRFVMAQLRQTLVH
jgi:hypothetical protein